ncbi:unnamed protein product [Effrenium voratum]|uniref:Uncharacterized protein n=1 Tax=Effrenium voratum TaxID=2562239 RepID=A0AA36IVE3_9DINO|nr:unnamed protein product [Effrenium voratum]
MSEAPEAQDGEKPENAAPGSPAAGDLWKRRKAYPALGISVIDAEENEDSLAIKFRGNGATSRNSLDLRTQMLKGRTKEQAELLAIAGGLQKGVEDLLAGRIFHPQAVADDWVDAVSQPSDSTSSDEHSEGPQSPAAEKVAPEKAAPEPEAPPVALRHKLVGMPNWAEKEVHSDSQESHDEEAAIEDSDDDSTGSFLYIDPHDIDDVVQEIDDGKLQQQVNLGRAATNRIMYEWKENARVKVMEDLNNWFQERKEKAALDAVAFDDTEAASKAVAAAEFEAICGIKTSIERKEMALVSSVSGFRQNMDKRIRQHWNAKRKARDDALAQVHKEEEERRQQRLRRQQERAAKRFMDIDDQIGELKDSIDQVKADIHKQELRQFSVPQKRKSAVGGNKATAVLNIIAAQQEEAQILSGKLAVQSQMLETIEDALEKAKAFFSSAAFKNKKVRTLPADDPAGEMVNEAMIATMKTVLAQLMFEDESLAETISLAISLTNRPGGKKRARNGFLRLDDILQDKEPKHAETTLGGEIVVSSDPIERQRKLQEIEDECTKLQEEITILEGVDHISVDGHSSPGSPRSRADAEEQEETDTRTELEKRHDQAMELLLETGTATIEAIRQKKAIFTTSGTKGRQKSEGGNSEGDAQEDPSAAIEAAKKELDQQKAKAAQLAQEEKEAKNKLKQLRAVSAKSSASPAMTRIATNLSASGSAGFEVLGGVGSATASDISAESDLEAEPEAMAWLGRSSGFNATGGSGPGSPGSPGGPGSPGSPGSPSTGAGGAVAATGTAEAGATASGGEGVPDVPGGGSSASSASGAGSVPASPSALGLRARRRSSIINLEEVQDLSSGLAKQLQENEAARKELEELQKAIEELKRRPRELQTPTARSQAPTSLGTPSLPATPVSPATTGGDPPSPSKRRSLKMVQTRSEPASPASPISPGRRSTSRGSRKSLASPRRASARPATEEEEEAAEEVREQNATRLKDLIKDVQKLNEEKDVYEKELASIEEKIRKVKSMDSGGVVALLKKDVVAEKKVDSAEVKEIKGDIKKKQAQVNAMRRTWQEMQGSNNRRNALIPGAEEERQREIAKRFAHVLSFLRAARETELAEQAKRAGLVTESNAQVVGRSASKFLSAIKKVRVAEPVASRGPSPMPPVPDDKPSERATTYTSGALLVPGGSPEGAAKQGFGRLMAEAMTGQRGVIGPGESPDEDAANPRFARRASMSLKAAPEEGGRRRSFDNILMKAKLKKPKDEESPSSKVNSAVRFAPAEEKSPEP